MAFRFSRGAPAVEPRGDGTNSKSRFAPEAAKNNNNNNSSYQKSLSYPAWLNDGTALRRAYYGSLGQVQVQHAIDSNNKLPNRFDRLVAKRKGNFSWDDLTDTSRVQQLLMTSRLSNSSLAAIWACCNKTKPGMLTNREVSLALGLIAMFQRVQDQQLTEDPFELLKLEKSPPVPKLYETARDIPKSRLSSSSSVPNDLLIDIFGESTNSPAPTHDGPCRVVSERPGKIGTSSNNLVSLIDLDSCETESTFALLANVWLQLMTSMQALFKRSFDILNVENSRTSAIEALATPDGARFCEGLSLCYPIAHNIKYKIDELKEAQVNYKSALFGDDYLSLVCNTMVSINEYWAVLINLFHSSGQTDFIELIMDGLIKTREQTIPSGTSRDLIGELTVENKRKTCAICLTESYLINTRDASKQDAKFPKEDSDIPYETKLMSLDNNFYYHPQCANFWLNSVPGSGGKLPFDSRLARNDTILKPTKQA